MKKVILYLFLITFAKFCHTSAIDKNHSYSETTLLSEDQTRNLQLAANLNAFKRAIQEANKITIYNTKPIHLYAHYVITTKKL